MYKNNPFSNKDLEIHQLYEKLKGYYDNNGLYENILAKQAESGEVADVIKGLITPVNRSVEFFASKIIPGDLKNVTITAKTEQAKEAILQIWKWSNFAAKKQPAVRDLSLLGNLFWKAVADDEKSWFETIEPKYVTSFKVDSRGYLTEIRLDIPVVIEEDNYTHTEFWTKEYYAIWIHKMGANTPLDQLSDPTEYAALSELKIDFIPIVHCKFREVSGNDLGVSCVHHALDKIDFANRLKTKLEQLAFNYGEPNVVIKTTNPENKPGPNSRAEDVKKVMGGKAILLGANQDIDWIIQNLPYADLLAIAQSTKQELEEDLPELKYYSLKDGQLSGQALRMLLSGAIDRAEEARGNLIQALVRINEICMTLGQVWGLFPTIGTYEQGDFEHSIQCPDMFPMTLAEKAANVKLFIDTGMALPTAMRFCGYSEEEIAKATEEKTAQDTKSEEIKVQALSGALQTFNNGV
jgi:hypothetical protein